MLLKITDGILTHYLDGFDEVRVQHYDGFNADEAELNDAENVQPLYLYLELEPSEPEPPTRDVVILQPTVGPKSMCPRTIVTDFQVYLLNDAGKTIEVLHRAK